MWDKMCRARDMCKGERYEDGGFGSPIIIVAQMTVTPYDHCLPVLEVCVCHGEKGLKRQLNITSPMKAPMSYTKWI